MGTKEIPCPICLKKTPYSQTNSYRPFCSERCKLIDLGAWASEEYSVPSEDETPHLEDNDADNP